MSPEQKKTLIKLACLLAVPVFLGALLRQSSPRWLATTLTPLLSYSLKTPDAHQLISVKGPFKKAATNQIHYFKIQTNSSMPLRDWVRKLGGLQPGYFLKKGLGRLSLAQWAANQQTGPATAVHLDLFQNSYYFPPYKKKNTSFAKKKEKPYGSDRIRYR